MHIDDIFKKILIAPVYDVAKISPLEKADNLSEEKSFEIFLKREDLQTVRSFKLRGAYYKTSSLTKAELDRGIIASSAGNHAQGVALAAKKLNSSALIVMPKTTPLIKVDAVRRLGAEVELYGDSYSDAADHAKSLVIKTGRIYIHPFDDPLVIAGQGTIAKELIDQLPSMSHIFVPVGGGGLIAGIACYVKSIRPDIKVIGVEPSDSNSMALSVSAQKRISMKHVGIFADGVAVKQVGKITYDIAKQLVDEFITVSNDQICAAIKQIFEANRSIVEPAGALSLAGINHYAEHNDMKNAKVVAINSGANMSFERLQFIAERTLLGSGLEALYSVQLPERPGSLRDFCHKVISGHNITQFAYRFNDKNDAKIFVGIGIKNDKDKQNFEKKMQKQRYYFSDFTYDDIAKEHIRHMIGGAANQAKNEHFFVISFPERPGALIDFLDAVSGEFNISLFHYRGQGGDTGNVMIGFEAKQLNQLEKSLIKSGYDWQRIDNLNSLKQFL